MDAAKSRKQIVKDLQQDVDDAPYSIVKRLKLANKFAELKYPDLTAGEAYLALLLCDETGDESGEYHEQALETALHDIESSGATNSDALEWLNNGIEQHVYFTLGSSLLKCGCLKSAFTFCSRALQKYPKDGLLVNLKKDIETGILGQTNKTDMKDVILDKISDTTHVRRELYDWNDHEPERCSKDTLLLLNSQLALVAPKLEVKAMELPDLQSEVSDQKLLQLGLFAKADIAPGELILDEKSLVTGTSRLLADYCDACSISRGTGYNHTAYCGDCADTTVFCSPECEELAQASYHPALCDTDALQVGKDPSIIDAADAMYAQLLLRVFAMSITQDIHPLDLPEVRYLCGNLASSTSTKSVRNLPFSFEFSILTPIHFLEKMDINIFTQSHRYNTSAINTLYAKFRGVASAKQGPNLLPEVAAVHPLWCLANHSCDPNVSWEWNGSMKFWAREERVAWLGKTETAKVGIQAGQEILSHYCDVRMPVKERRDWASGALGGECQCERCLWEEKIQAADESREDG